MKNGDGAADHTTAYLTWVAYIGGTRESRRLIGDVILSQGDIVSKTQFSDGCVPSTWSIDLHYPKKQYGKKYPNNPFISVAVHDQRIDRNFGYPIPYRCFYSRNISNLFMAGRCISVTHEALGTTRVMKTCGMMGEVVGRAASICIKHDCLPRDVYDKHWAEMAELLNLPGKARRTNVNAEIQIPADALPLAEPSPLSEAIDPASLAGLVVDDPAARLEGDWTVGTGLPGYVGTSYLYAAKDSQAAIHFTFNAPSSGTYELRLAYQPHENRATNVPVEVRRAEQHRTFRVNMQEPPPAENGMISLGNLDLSQGEPVTVTISTKGCDGFVHADAIQVLRVDRP